MLKNIDSLVILSLGIILLGLGLSTLLFPDIMGRYGLSTETAHAKATIVALIGGAEIGLGCFLLFGRFVGVSPSMQLWSMLSLFVGIAIARIYSIWVYHPELPNIAFRELVAELLIITLITFGIRTSVRKRRTVCEP